MANFGSLVVALNANIAGFAQGMSKAEGMLAKFSKSMNSLGGGLALGGGAIFGGMMVKDFADFEDAMLRVKAVTSATQGEMQLLTARVHQLAKQSGVDQNSIWGIMLELGRANFNPKEINSVSEAVVNLSKASGSDAAKSGEILSSMINAFALSAEDAAMVADKLAAAANGSQTNVEQLGEAMAYVGTIGKDLGVSMDETLAMMGVLGNLSTQGSMAGTSVRRLFLDMGAHAQQMSEVFGQSFIDINGNFVGATRAMQIMAEATAGMTAPERLEKFEAAFGTLGVTAGSSLTQMLQMYEELKLKIADSTGVAAAQAAEMETGVGGSIRRLMNSWTEFKTAFITQWAEGISIVLDTLSGWLTSASEGFSWLEQFVTESFLVIMVTWNWVWDNAQDLLTYYVGSIILKISEMGDLVWSVFSWIAGVAVTSARNMGDAYGTIIQNMIDNFIIMASNVKEIFKSMWDYIKNLGSEPLEFNLESTKGLLDGVITQELPKYESKVSGITEMIKSKTDEAFKNLGKDTLSDRLGEAFLELDTMRGENKPPAPEWDPTKSPAFRGDQYNPSTGGALAAGLREAMAANQVSMATAEVGNRGTAKAYDIIMKARESKQLQFLGQIEKNTAEAVAAMKNLAGAGGMMGGAGAMFGVAEGLLN